MAKLIKTEIKAEATFTLQLNESEARALDGIFGYNVDAFLKVFYERMGTAYVAPHESGVRSLHATVRSQLAQPLSQLETARNAVNQALGRVW